MGWCVDCVCTGRFWDKEMSYSRSLRLVLWFCVGLLLGGVTVYVHAETIPATYTSPCPAFTYVVSSGNYCELEEACTKQGLVFFTTLPGKIQCRDQATGQYTYLSYTVKSGRFFTCPENGNWTLSDTTCIRPNCSAEEERDANGVCIPKCTDEQERVNGVCLPKCDTGQIRAENGTCRPYCWGAQFYDEAANTCKCITQQPTTTSWQVSEANAKAGKVDPPRCVNGCEQGVSTFGGLAVSFCPGGLATMVIGGSTTCYGKVGQTGATCAPGGSAPGGALIPVSVTPAPAGTGPSGAADPYSTTPNNSDPTSCAAAGGNWGVFNGKGNCYTPTPSDPAVSQSQQKNVVTNPDGSTHTTTTTTTNTCTGAGACSSSTTTNTTTNNASGGGGGGSGGMSVTTNNGAGTATGTVTKAGEGQYKIDLPKDYQKDSTGLILNAIVTDIKDVIGKPTGDDESITGAKASDDSAKSVSDAQEEVRQLMTGEKNIAEVSEKMTAWEQVMKEGFFEPISISGCEPFSHTFNFFATSYTWNLDHCPTAADISEIGAYCMWVLLVFSGFRMLTTPRKEG